MYLYTQLVLTLAKGRRGTLTILVFAKSPYTRKFVDTSLKIDQFIGGYVYKSASENRAPNRFFGILHFFLRVYGVSI